VAADRPPSGRKAWKPDLPVRAAPPAAWLLALVMLGALVGAMGIIAVLS